MSDFMKEFGTVRQWIGKFDANVAAQDRQEIGQIVAGPQSFTIAISQRTLKSLTPFGLLALAETMEQMVLQLRELAKQRGN